MEPSVASAFLEAITGPSSISKVDLYLASTGLSSAPLLNRREQAGVLVQTGLLTIRAGKDTTYWVVPLGIPNVEVMQVVLPRLLEQVYQLDSSTLLSAETAGLLQQRNTAGFFARLMESQLDPPASKDLSGLSQLCHEYPPAGVMSEIVRQLGQLFPSTLYLRYVHAEAASSGDRKKLDVAVTVTVKKAVNSPPEQDTILVWQLQMLDPAASPTMEDFDQLQHCMTKLDDVPGDKMGWVVLCSSLDSDRPEEKVSIRCFPLRIYAGSSQG